MVEVMHTVCGKTAFYTEQEPVNGLLIDQVTLVEGGHPEKGDAML